MGRGRKPNKDEVKEVEIKKEEVKKEKAKEKKTIKLALSFPKRTYFYGGKVLTGNKPFEVEINSAMYYEIKHAGRIGKKGHASFYIVEDK